MAGVNKVIIIGNLGSDPELRTMPNGTPVANINVATSEAWTDRNTNERREVTEWHRIVLYRRLAEIAGEYLRKGSKVYIEGKLKTRKWQDQQTGQDRYMTEIQADNLQMLDSRGQQNAGFNGGSNNYNGQNNNQSGYNNNNQNNFGNNQSNYNNNQNNYNTAAVDTKPMTQPAQTTTKASPAVKAPANTAPDNNYFEDDDMPF